MNKLEELLAWGGTKKDITFLALSGMALLISILGIPGLPFNAAWIAIILCGVPIICEAIIGLVTEFDIKADVLVSIALVAAVVIGEDFAAGEVAFIMQLGALLEDLTVAKARAGIEKLVHLMPRTARVLRGGQEEIIDAAAVRQGEILRVLPGETIAADGVITSGKTSVDQAVMTGESMPVDKSEGDEVRSGTVNQLGAFEMKADRVGEDSSLQRMIRLVQSADAGKAKIVGIADRWATWIVVIALTSALVTGLVTGEVIRAVTILVVFCPCALVLATPTAIMAAIGNVTKYGILVREGDALERLAAVRKLTFDKTGTLTYGKPEVIAVESYQADLSEQQLYDMLAAAEWMSEHPLGQAIVRSYREKYGSQPQLPANFEMIPGRGVSAIVDGKTVAAGNAEFMRQTAISGFPDERVAVYNKQGSTVVFIGIDGQAAGLAVLADQIRDTAAETISQIRASGMEPVLLTGDHAAAARQVADKIGIKELYAECLPEQKLHHIDAFQQRGEAVCMIGDGINDAPALKKADVGIAMGAAGSDIAVDAADIVLVHDDIANLPHLLMLSKRMMGTIKLNMGFSMGLNFAAIILAATGVLNPVVGALVHNAGSILVIVNSALLLRWKKDKV